MSSRDDKANKRDNVKAAENRAAGMVLVNGKWVYKPPSDEELAKAKAAGYKWNPKTGKFERIAGNGDGGGGSGGSGGGSGGGGGGSGQGYLEEYRLRFHTTGRPPANLLSQATANNWSLAYFDMQVRRQDPSYWKSKEAQKLLPDFNRTMKVLFPGLAKSGPRTEALMKSGFYKRQALWYLKNGIGLHGQAGQEMLFDHITRSKRWNENNPYWRAYSRNRDAAVVAEANPMLYKQYVDVLKQSFTSAGIKDLPDDYYRTFFRGRYASESGMKELQSNLQTYAQAGGAYGWWQGQGMDSGQTKTATLDSGGKGRDLRSRLSKAFNVQTSLLKSESKGFQADLNEQGKVTNPLL